MELYFNELSLKNRDSMDNDSIVVMTEVYKELLRYNITTCRIASEDNARLFQMISNMPNSSNVKNFYFSFFRSPYESEGVEEKQDDYYGYSWLYDGEECIGFALAVILDSASFSIYSPCWNMPFIDIAQDEVLDKVRNICVKGHVDIHIPHIQNKEEIVLVTCDIEAESKRIALRNDHGMDVLKDFSKRLLRCPYLIGIVNSLPYNPYERKFIKRIRENGLIEIVLPWTDKGYGVVVKTTGRNIREIKRIAEILEKEFGYID